MEQRLAIHYTRARNDSCASPKAAASLLEALLGADQRMVIHPSRLIEASMQDTRADTNAAWIKVTPLISITGKSRETRIVGASQDIRTQQTLRICLCECGLRLWHRQQVACALFNMCRMEEDMAISEAETSLTMSIGYWSRAESLWLVMQVRPELKLSWTPFHTPLPFVVTQAFGYPWPCPSREVF